MKDKLGRKFITKLVGLKAKPYSYLIDDGIEYKKAKSLWKSLKLENHLEKLYKKYLEATKLENKIKYLKKNKINVGNLKKQ